jgi:tetratricopeptide (TPR) repeat protein
MNPRPLAFAAALTALAVAPATASAQRNRGGATQPAGQQNLLELGRQQYDNLRYEEAIQTLSAAIIRRGNTPQSEIQIYELLALSYQALNRNDEAEGAYRLVLVRDPNHQLSSDIAPRIIEFFNGVKQRWQAEGRPGIEGQQIGTSASNAAPPAPVAIEHRSPPQQQRNHAVPLTATLHDPGHRVARLVLAYRTGSSGLFRRMDAAAGEGGQYTATVPAEAVRPPLVEYYFEAVDATGVPVQARGDAFAPLRVAVPAPGGVPVWVWPVGGAVILGGAAAIIIGVVVAGQSQPAHVTVNVQGM